MQKLSFALSVLVLPFAFDSISSRSDENRNGHGFRPRHFEGGTGARCYGCFAGAESGGSQCASRQGR
jgi:hypothetical protein